MIDEGAGDFLARLSAKLSAAAVPHMVVGSFASSFHGVPRSSQDLDLGTRVFVASPEDTVISKLEWAKLGGSELQLRDASGILQLLGTGLDRAYIERWVTELGLKDLWQRVTAAQ
jgi:hypothetical protein